MIYAKPWLSLREQLAQRLRDLLLKGFPDLNHLGLNLGGVGVDEGWEQRPR